MYTYIDVYIQIYTYILILVKNRPKLLFECNRNEELWNNQSTWHNEHSDVKKDLQFLSDTIYKRKNLIKI